MSPGLIAIPLEGARAGLPVRVNARLARIRPADLDRWLAEGDRDDATSDQLRFTRDYLEQFALFVADQHEDIATSRASGKDAPNTSARLALLARLCPEDYGLTPHLDAPPPAVSPIASQVAQLPPEVRAALRSWRGTRPASQRATEPAAARCLRACARARAGRAP